MMRTRTMFPIAFAIIATWAGCGRKNDDAVASTRASGNAEAVPAVATPGQGGCVLAELWSACLLRKALENAGLAPREQDSLHYPFFKAAGRRWILGRAELQTFIYPTTAALDADLAGFDTTTGQPRKGRDHVQWAAPPIVIRNRNLLALLIGGSERHDERIRNALEAGVLSTRPR